MLLAITTAEEDVLDVVLTVVELEVVVLLVVVEEEEDVVLDELDELDELLEELLELVVLFVATVYANVVVPLAVPPGPPHVALTVYVPVFHPAIPPGTDV